jgi:nucleotide-binding universal stress UspA family protein
MPFHKILLAVNDAEYAQKPAQFAFELADKLGAELGVIHVVDYRMILPDMENNIMAPNIFPILEKEAKKTVEKIIESYHGDKEVQRFLPEGNPTTEILNTAEKWGADLIIIGTHGKSGLMMILKGSIGEYIQHHAKVPVLIVPTQS